MGVASCLSESHHGYVRYRPCTTVARRDGVSGKEAIARIFAENRVVAAAWSSGRDSSVVLALVLEVALEAKKAGGNPTILVTSSDTLVDHQKSASTS